MPRKAFIADVQVAAEQNIDGIINVCRGDDDGDVNASYVPVSGAPIELSLLVTPDVGSYPVESCFMIITKSDDIPDGVQSILQGIAETSAGFTIPQLLNAISRSLQSSLATGTDVNPYTIDSDQDMSFAESEPDEDQSEYEDYASVSDFGEGGGGNTASASATFNLTPEQSVTLNRRIKEDLRAVRFAGFKIGILSGMRADSINSMLSISVQVKKLGLSEEATQAWDLEPTQYVVLLIRYSNGYKSFETVLEEAAQNHDVTFRIGTCKKYKPTMLEALASFAETSRKPSDKVQDPITEDNTQASGFSSMFISSSLNDFTNASFISLLKIRASCSLTWDGAKLFFNEKQGRHEERSEALGDEYYADPAPPNSTLPTILTADHLSDQQNGRISFPLIAAQFSLRYLTRCTEFCLVCHDEIKEDFEALKPFVCDRPLCLYQYMSLGFGPSVEHEILTQPYVVDLLVSFCYASAMNRRLREYPVGMSLAVPPIVGAHVTTQQSSILRGRAAVPAVVVGTSVDKPEAASHSVKYDALNHEIVFLDEGIVSPVRHGDWVILVTATGTDHFRVEEGSLFPTVRLSEVCVTRNTTFVEPRSAIPDNLATPSTTPPPPSSVAAKLFIYNENFDDLSENLKAEAIVVLLETLPSIKEMRTYLLQQTRVSEPSLRNWKDRISPAALGILRWIIASNRSCIVQVDKCPGQDDADLIAARVHLEQRITNITPTWVQFRFAQGSPDKEQRFLNALRAEQANLDAKYPTLFAFHGSPLANWHSIIRTGLNFNETLHGRAFGHGVYHAMEQSISIGYAQPAGSIWQGSSLKIGSAMSLNEIVNCPAKFASCSPYLVVQHTDWIQCRYLLVQVLGTNDSYHNGTITAGVSAESEPEFEVLQDPVRVAKSVLGTPIGVPTCAAATSRAFRVNLQSGAPSKKKRKQSVLGLVGSEDSTVPSDIEDSGDLLFLCSDDDEEQGKGESKAAQDNIAKFTDFVPGSLDQSKLPMLEPPSYATPMATKTLNRNLREILDIQKKTPLHELGWYLDEQLISNVYQWIVELHSFEPDLPLAKDMKLAGVTSIVLEIRFGKDYPFSPPFVRVIRPRFLPFTMGGGGHVTGGGAMCMELLTNSGWSSVSSIEGVLLQVRLAMSNLEPRPARLEPSSVGNGSFHSPDYGTGEAMAAYIRACQTHGWAVPKDFEQFAGISGSDF